MKRDPWKNRQHKTGCWNSGQFTPQDCLRLKGIAILMIVLHNFFHLLSPAPRENEFRFVRANSVAFINMMLDQPQEIIRCVFSFLGHFGVQIFIFLSAYGMTRKFLASRPAYGAFIKSRYQKIYPVFLLAIGLWLLKIAVFSGPLRAMNHAISKDLLFPLLTIANLVPEQHFKPVGPWWFMSFIFQFYFMFPLLFTYSQKLNQKGLILLGAAGVLFMAGCNDTIVQMFNINLFFSPIGHLPEIVLGMLCAQRTRPVKYPVFTGLIALTVFILGTVYEAWWYLNHISALITLLALYQRMQPVCRKLTPMDKGLLFYGTISLPLFLTNGYLRQPLLNLAQNQPCWLTDILYAFLFLLLATIVSTVLYGCHNVITQKYLPKVMVSMSGKTA